MVVPEPERMSHTQEMIAMQTAGINQEHGIGDVTFSEEQEEESEDPPVSEEQSADTPEL